MKRHQFFQDILDEEFKKSSDTIYKKSHLLRYLAIKTQSVEKSSKSRANLGNLYAIYVLVEHYLKYGKTHTKFSNLLKRQRELPFGEKLQNHALNHRCNQEFSKFFPEEKEILILRNTQKKEYWINEKLLLMKINSKKYDISKIIMRIIENYIKLKTDKFNSFLEECLSFEKDFDKNKFIDFIKSQLLPNVDARMFEVVSFCILKNYYQIKKLSLYKTGRTNANDGGIDFVLKQKGRFFQVSEVLDFKKYFLDIDKINRFPITFVIKSDKSPEELMKLIEDKAKEDYDKKTLKKYIDAIEEVISLPLLNKYLEEIIKKRNHKSLLKDLIIYYKLEFNIKLG